MSAFIKVTQAAGIIVVLGLAIVIGASSTLAGNPPRFSDSFDRANATDCDIGQADNALGGTETRYYMPIYPAGAKIDSNALANSGLDYGGAEFTDIGCNSGMDIGADLNMRVELTVPTDGSNNVTQAGPFFRSRSAHKKDGIIGGTAADPSGGYWIQLHSTGEIKVKNLRDNSIVATSPVIPSFDISVAHTLEMAAMGTELQIILDAHAVSFCQEGAAVTTIAIKTDTNLPGDTNPGNDGTAGIVFASEPNRGAIGGQKADNLVVSPYLVFPHGVPNPGACGGPSVWGDDNCDGAVGPGDALAKLRQVVNLSLPQPAGCPEIGALAFVHDETYGDNNRVWGDTQCNGEPDAGDVVSALAFAATGVPITPTPGCPPVGTPITPAS